MPSITKARKPRERLEDFAREIGTLLVALTPLDAVVWDARLRFVVGAIYIAIGVMLVAGATASEHGRLRERPHRS